MKTESSFRTIAFLGDYLPRKCGIATFTSELLGTVAARHPQSRCFAVPVNDIEACYQYPEVVRFEKRVITNVRLQKCNCLELTTWRRTRS